MKFLLHSALRPILASCVLVSGSAVFSSCSNDDLAKRLERRNEKYSSYNDRRRMRLQARQERTDMWFDRVMGL